MTASAHTVRHCAQLLLNLSTMTAPTTALVSRTPSGLLLTASHRHVALPNAGYFNQLDLDNNACDGPNSKSLGAAAPESTYHGCANAGPCISDTCNIPFDHNTSARSALEREHFKQLQLTENARDGPKRETLRAIAPESTYHGDSEAGYHISQS